MPGVFLSLDLRGPLSAECRGQDRARGAFDRLLHRQVLVVCMYVFIYLYICIYIYVCMYGQRISNFNKHNCMYVYGYMYVYVCMAKEFQTSMNIYVPVLPLKTSCLCMYYYVCMYV